MSIQSERNGDGLACVECPIPLPKINVIEGIGTNEVHRRICLERYHIQGAIYIQVGQCNRDRLGLNTIVTGKRRKRAECTIPVPQENLDFGIGLFPDLSVTLAISRPVACAWSVGFS
jgi:hypothetical protein